MPAVPRGVVVRVGALTVGVHRALLLQLPACGLTGRTGSSHATGGPLLSLCLGISVLVFSGARLVATSSGATTVFHQWNLRGRDMAVVVVPGLTLPSGARHDSVRNYVPNLLLYFLLLFASPDHAHR